MTFPVDALTEWDALNATAQMASTIFEELADLQVPAAQYTLPLDIESCIPNLIFAIPDDVFSPLSALSISTDIFKAIMQRLHRLIFDLQQLYGNAYRKACLETVRRTNDLDNLDSIHQTFQALFQRRCLPMIQSQITFIVAEVDKRENTTRETKRPFNNDFIPVLEKYFVFNGYPSIAHRSILAQKSGMQPRQIEVWFQNHRNRAKKDGKIIPRLGTETPLRLSLELLSQKTYIQSTRLPTPFDDEKVVHNETNEPQKPELSTTFTISSSLDNWSRPPHAYPAPMNSQYPEPFPNDHGKFTFPPPSWRRKPATVPIISKAIDMDEFASTFHLKLNFAESQRRRGILPSHTETPSFQPWFAATTTFTSPAPHPALIRTTDLPPRSVLASLVTPFTVSPTFGSSSFPLSMSTYPTPRREGSSRKAKQLPRRRAPKSRSRSFGSRTSSFGSDTSSGSRLSSSSNHSSPGLLTPPSLPHIDLPDVDIQHSISQSDFPDFTRSINSNPPFLSLSDPQGLNISACESTNPNIDKNFRPLFYDDNFSEFAHNLEDLLF